MTNWTFHNFDVCPRCVAAILQHRCSFVSTTGARIYSFIVPTRAVKVSLKSNQFLLFLSTACDIVTGGGRKEEVRDIGRVMNTMHLGPRASSAST